MVSPLPRNEPACFRRSLWIYFLTALVLQPALLTLASTAFAQPSTDSSYYARRNAFGVFGAYSGDSSHIVLGDAEKRKLLNLGVSYSRRLFLDHRVNWQYDGELIPVALEGDPLSRYVVRETSPKVVTTTTDGGPMISCAPVTTSYSYTDQGGVLHSGSFDTFCHGRQWTVGEAMSPIGSQLNLLPRRKTQPFVSGHGGYMYSTQAIPLAFAGSFNFTFDVGAGVEFYRSPKRSIRAEYRYHHISNHGTATDNPGIDNGVVQLSYVFGR